MHDPAATANAAAWQASQGRRHALYLQRKREARGSNIGPAPSWRPFGRQRPRRGFYVVAAGKPITAMLWSRGAARKALRRALRTWGDAAVHSAVWAPESTTARALMATFAR